MISVKKIKNTVLHPTPMCTTGWSDGPCVTWNFASGGWDMKVPQEKCVCHLVWPLPTPWLISQAPLAIFQSSPRGTILLLWEKCNIWLVKSTITSAADNQRTAYLFNSPSQEWAAKESTWVTVLIQPKIPSPGCCTAYLHFSQPTYPLQDKVGKGPWSAPREHLNLSPVTELIMVWAGSKGLWRSSTLFSQK